MLLLMGDWSLLSSKPWAQLLADTVVSGLCTFPGLPGLVPTYGPFLGRCAVDGHGL